MNRAPVHVACAERVHGGGCPEWVHDCVEDVCPWAWAWVPKGEETPMVYVNLVELAERRRLEEHETSLLDVEQFRNVRSRVCVHPDCGAPLRIDNTSDRCPKHRDRNRSRREASARRGPRARGA